MAAATDKKKAGEATDTVHPAQAKLDVALAHIATLEQHNVDLQANIVKLEANQLPDRHVAMPLDLDEELMTHRSEDQSTPWDGNSPSRNARRHVLESILEVLADRAIKAII